jgi:hypothetical protein
MSLSTEDLIPPDHPIRRIRLVVVTVLAELDDTFDRMQTAAGRCSVPPETLLKDGVDGAVLDPLRGCGRWRHRARTSGP